MKRGSEEVPVTTGDMSEQPQLQLPIVRNYESITRFGNECVPDLILIFLQGRLVPVEFTHVNKKKMT